jgi:recombination protein RecT
MTAQTITGAVAKRDRSDQLVSWIRKQQDDIAMAAASHIKPSAIVRVTQGALRRDDKLLAAAIANPQSLLYALLDCARLGHEPDTDDYYLVPFGQEVTGIEGYKGIIERMFRAGGVTSVVAQVVRQRDRYAPRGENTPPLHEYDDFASAEERGAMRGAYAYAIFTSGHCSQVIRMGRAEIMEHKAASRGSNRSDSPWQVWEPAMWKKTVLRGLEPYVPTSNEFRTAPPPGRYADPYVITDQNAVPGVSGDGEIVEAEIVDEPPPSNGTARQDEPKPAARTARRKTAAAGDSTRSQRAAGDQAARQDGADEHGANPAPAAAGTAPPRVPQPLPPLPGEDEPPDPTRPAAPAATSTGTGSSTAPAADGPSEPGAPGSDRHRKLVGVVRAHFKRLGYTDADDEIRLQHTARLAGTSEIGSTNDLDEDELSAVADTLARCKNVDALQALLNAGEVDG